MLEKKVLKLDASGEFQAREVSGNVGRISLLKRIDELKVLSKVADAGLLSGAESAGLFSTLEQKKAFSTIEKILPAADKVGALTLAEELVNTPPTFLLLGAAGLVAGEVAILGAVPDDSVALVALQGGLGLVAGIGAATLAVTAFLISVVQGE
mmetsp:Transcript_15677/g.47946  ORF Transcript_15677/g.47946 Transcript_15677/m.47946 type:complete len:153 (+) Transcript_15677:1-459(+)